MRNLAVVGLLAIILAGCISWKPFTSEQKPELSATLRHPIREARGVWLHRFEYCNYTSTFDQDSIRQYIRQVIQRAAEANFNIIFFQVRGNGDAYYTPGLEPWGNLLTGALGEDPGWDPLQFAIREAHKYGLELHAWLNTFPAWRGTTPPPESTPRLAILEHPEWVVCDSSGTPMPYSGHYVSLSPGIPAVHDHIISVVTDIIRRYDIDGIHFDYIRYPEDAPDHGYSHDSISVARYNSVSGNPFDFGWEDWQRAQLNQFVYKAYNAITTADSGIKMSAAVIGAYETGTWNAYRVVYQDPRRWTEMEKIDFVVPMTYWENAHPTHSFVKLTREWQDRYIIDRPVFPGIGSYRFVPENELDWSEAEKQIAHLRKRNIPGMVFFDAQSLMDHWEKLGTGLFQFPALLPQMPWKKSSRPDPVSDLNISLHGDRIELTWNPPAALTTADSSSIHRLLIYVSTAAPMDRLDRKNLLAVIPGDTTRWWLQLDGNMPESGTVGISVMNRSYQESRLTVRQL